MMNTNDRRRGPWTCIGYDENLPPRQIVSSSSQRVLTMLHNRLVGEGIVSLDCQFTHQIQWTNATVPTRSCRAIGQIRHLGKSGVRQQRPDDEFGHSVGSGRVIVKVNSDIDNGLFHVTFRRKRPDSEADGSKGEATLPGRSRAFGA